MAASIPIGNVVGPADQRSQIKTFNIAPSWTRLISPTTVFTLGAFVRRDDYNYYPSANPFADLGAPGLQSETVSQRRTLTNAGLRSDLSYVKGIHNIKVGATYEQTFLNENDPLGIVDPTFNAPCLDASGIRSCWRPGVNEPAMPVAATPTPFSTPRRSSRNRRLQFIARLLRLDSYNSISQRWMPDATSGLYTFNGHTDVKELALYVQDIITKGNWALNLGLRGDFYNGLTTHREAEPRLGRRLQRQADQHRSARFLCAHHGDSIQ